MSSIVALALLFAAGGYVAYQGWSRRLSGPAVVLETALPLGHGLRIRLAFAGFIMVAAVWQLASNAIGDATFLPSPRQSLVALIDIWTNQGLASDILLTCARVAIGMGVAGGVGVTIGGIAGVFPRLGAVVLPVNSALRYIPPSSFIGLSIIYMGISEAQKISLIGLAVVWYVVQMVADVVRQVPRILVESVELLGANRRELLTKVYWPLCLPEVLAVIRVNLGAAWTYVIVAEFVTGQNGLGYALALNQRLLQTPAVFALLIVLGAVGFLSDSIFAGLIRWSGRWK